MLLRLQQLLNIYLSGKLTDSQRLELIALLESEDGAKQFETLVQQQLAGDEFAVDGNLTNTENRIVEGVIKKIQSVPAAPVHRVRFLRRWGWAAAAVLIIGIGSYWWFANRNVQRSIAGD